MNIDQVIKYFGTQVEAARQLGVTQPTLSNWRSRGNIPALQQLRIEHLTKGKIKASAGILPRTKLSRL
jgi:DNA-binding transcriptional regulator YdaS (Cro superfamily)